MDFVDWLVWELGMLFCDVYYVIGVFVVKVEVKFCDLLDLFLDEMKEVYEGIIDGVFDVLMVENLVVLCLSYGGILLVCVCE